jgi:acetylornithine deacetylase/succinyl-diaminopimelate desuccinylase-like protein
MRPTLDVNGIYGGYMKEGANTIIPAQVGAKMSMRLVPNQQSADISRKFDAAIRERCPSQIRCEILDHAHAGAFMIDRGGKLVTAAEKALKDTFGRDVAFIRSGGSLPILPMFKEQLGADSLLLGFASPRCNAHGPNEKVNIADLDRGAETVARLLAHLGE